MSTELKDLKKLNPTKFPSNKDSNKSVIYKVEKTGGKPTKEVVAEMRRLSKKGIYVTE
jgi:hypothetical protein